MSPTGRPSCRKGYVATHLRAKRCTKYGILAGYGLDFIWGFQVLGPFVSEFQGLGLMGLQAIDIV